MRLRREWGRDDRMDHGVDGKNLMLDQVSALQWCEFYSKNNLTLDQVTFVSFEMLLFIALFLYF